MNSMDNGQTGNNVEKNAKAVGPESPVQNDVKDAEAQGWFSPDCPYCGSSRVASTNKAERAGSLIAGAATALVAGAFIPVAAPVGYVAAKALCDHADYICLNCKETFSVKR